MTRLHIRIWQKNRVRCLLTLTSDGMTFASDVGGAANSTRPDIEYDPWEGLVVDHRLGDTTPLRLADHPDALDLAKEPPF